MMEVNNHVQSISEKLEAIVNGELYICPECGEYIAVNEICSECKAEVDPDTLELVSLYDFFEGCYDVEYRVNGNKEYRSVCIMVACGGPNIYVDTGSKTVDLHWWGTTATYPLSSNVVDAIDDLFEELYNN